MSWSEAIEARAARGAEARRNRLAAAIAGRLGELPGIEAASDGGAVVVSGRGLLRRWLNDARLRFAGSAR